MGRPDYHRDVESHDEPISQCRSWISVFIWCVVGYICIITVFIGVCFLQPSFLDLRLLPLFVQGAPPTPFYAFSQGSGHFHKPQDLKIIGLVPFHDYERTGILDCYLQRNLIHNHGVLDQVIFIPKTNDTESLRWLTSTVEQTALYTISEPSMITQSDPTKEDVMYIWIDGDVVFLEDHTIPSIVKTKLDHSNSLVVSANVVNQAALNDLHSHPGVALPYLPELMHMPVSDQSERIEMAQDWRASHLPPWKGPVDFKVEKGFSPPYNNHRWLLATADSIDRTPIGMSVYTDDGPGLDHWSVHAQQHYSFLHHLELGDLHRYKFPMWENPTEAVSQNLLCFWASDHRILESVILQDGSNNLVLKATQEVKGRPRHVIIDGKGLGAHYSVASSEGLEATDILQRYRAYAQEKVCLETS